MTTTYNTLYNALITIYEQDPPTLTQEKRDTIPVLLAFIAIHMNDTDKVSEVIDKFGPESFTTPVTAWGIAILRSMGIDFLEERPPSPTNIQDIETNIN
tara:strand:+ start:110 stop:406 length:297 start_codon:yes stop_codon:yes gene_type:complete